MTDSRERGLVRLLAQPGRRTLSLALLALLAAAGTTASPLSAMQVRSLEDTTRARPLLFHKTVGLETSYLARALEAALEKDRAADEGRASAYAKRYRISTDLAQKIIDVARAEGIDPELGFRLIRVESVFKPNARGPAGAVGLTQVMPGTARSVDRSVDTRAELQDPQTNLRIGFRYLRQMIERYDGDVRLGLLAYNRGETSVNRALKRGRDPENGYSHKVLGTRSSNPYRGKGLLTKSSSREGGQSERERARR